jgi:60 kDa SS-A/Ro ribonucleoprotein
MAMTFARIESGSKQEFAGFSSSTSSFSYSRGRSFLRKINIDPSMSLEQAMRCTQFGDFGTTDCSLPIEDAIQLFKSSGGREGLWDVFMIYTDNETFAGARHPSEALAEYRKLTGIPAKMVVIATTPNSSTIADPADGGMLDVSGFDTNAPEIVMNFIRGDALDSGLEAGAVVAEEDE